MINFSDGYIFATIRAVGKNPKLLDILRGKRFRVADTTLSYRQITSLDASDVLVNTQEQEGKWRTFSLKDVIYLMMIMECRKYGIKNEQLKTLKNDFYYEGMKDETLFQSDELIWGEVAIYAVLQGLRVSWLLFPDGKSMFCDEVGLLYFQGWARPESTGFLHLNFNEVVRKTLEQSANKDLVKKFKEYPPLIDFERFFEAVNLTKEQLEIVKIIRHKDYSKVTIMRGKGTYKVYGENTKGAEELTEDEIIEIMKKKEFSNIKVQKRDGKIVNYQFEDVIKV